MARLNAGDFVSTWTSNVFTFAAGDGLAVAGAADGEALVVPVWVQPLRTMSAAASAKNRFRICGIPPLLRNAPSVLGRLAGIRASMRSRRAPSMPEADAD